MAAQVSMTLWWWIPIMIITNAVARLPSRTLIVSIPVVHNFSDSITFHPFFGWRDVSYLYIKTKRRREGNKSKSLTA